MSRLLDFKIASAARKVAWVGCAAAAIATPVHADPLTASDEFITSALILRECHVDISVPPSEAREAKITAMGDAAWHELWAVLDKKDPAHHDENARKADFELKKRSEADRAQARDLVSRQGCAALVPRARDQLKDYFR